MKGVIAPAVQERPGLLWVAAYYALLAVIGAVTFFLDDGLFARFSELTFIVVYAYVAFGLLQADKPAWHLAAFFAFIGIIVNGVATACAPGNIADGDITLFEASGTVTLLVLSFFVFAYLRKPDVRAIYGVPQTYRNDERDGVDEP